MPVAGEHRAATVELSWTSLSACSHSTDELLTLLAPDERRRAGRFRVADACRRFAAARAMARNLIAQHLGVEPRRVALRAGSRGKPALMHDPPEPHFNLAHSGDLAVVAIASRELGVDVEELRPVPRAERLAARFFADSERRWLSRLPQGRRDLGFLALWTCKEAYLKATGTGIELPLTAIVVDPERPALVRTPDGRHRDWHLLRADLPVPSACVVAIRGSGWRLEVREFDWGTVEVES